MKVRVLHLWVYFCGWLFADFGMYYFGWITDVHATRHEDATVAFFLILVTIFHAILENEKDFK
jgi:hypothetical protein